MPAPPGVTPDILFRVRRSRYQQLPVYSDYKNGRTRILTKISKIDGDIVVSLGVGISTFPMSVHETIGNGEDASRALAVREAKE